MGLGEGVFSLLIIGCVEVGAAALPRASALRADVERRTLALQALPGRAEGVVVVRGGTETVPLATPGVTADRRPEKKQTRVTPTHP